MTASSVNYSAIFRRICLITFVMLLAIPVTITQYNELDIPIAIIAFFVSIPFYFMAPNNNEKICLTVAIVLSFLSILYVATFIRHQLTMNPFLSLSYFFMPYFLYFLGYCLVKSEKDVKLILSLFSCIFLIVACLITISIIKSGGDVRGEGELLGSLLGLKLYGTYGVNTLAIFYATMLAIILIYLFFCDNVKLLKIVIFTPGIICLLYLLFGSASREAILGSLAFLLLFIVKLFRINKAYSILLCITIFFTIFITVTMYGDKLMIIWSFKMLMSHDAITAGDIDVLSSGRLSLVTVAISDISKNLVFGNGFHGFGLYGYVGDVVGVNNSPHNQYLTAIWKMGILPSIFYFCFLYNCLKKLYFLQRRHNKTNIYLGIWTLVIVYLLVFCFIWDVFLVPSLGMIIMFLLGAVARQYTRRKLPLCATV